jgi:hypothetical protein
LAIDGQYFAKTYHYRQSGSSYKLANSLGKMSCFASALYIPTSYCYRHVGRSVSWGQAVFSVRISCLILFVILLNPSKERTGKYFVISHNHSHIPSNSFSCFGSHYLTFFSSIPTTPANGNRIGLTNTDCCVYSVEIRKMMDSGHVRNL